MFVLIERERRTGRAPVSRFVLYLLSRERLSSSSVVISGTPEYYTSSKLQILTIGYVGVLSGFGAPFPALTGSTLSITCVLPLYGLDGGRPHLGFLLGP